jgi:ABC-type nitrate/sulfonate/bicarbonate transport system permease component
MAFVRVGSVLPQTTPEVEAPGADSTPVPSGLRAVRGGPLSTSRNWTLSSPFLGSAGVAASLIVWEFASRASLVPTDYVPPASEVLRELGQRALVPEFWASVGATMQQWALGMVLTILIAIPVGLLMGSVELVWRSFRPIVEFMRPVPGMALIPLTILIWGLSATSVIFLTVFGCAWSLIVSTMYGVHSVDAGARDTARSYGLTTMDRVRWLVLPSALPHIATGLRIASATALMIVIGAELVIGVEGVGSDIAMAQTAGNYLMMYSLILASGGLGIAIHLLFSRLERHYLRWHPSQQAGGAGA